MSSSLRPTIGPAAATAQPEAAPTWRPMLWLFAGSLLLRLLVGWPAVAAHVEPAWDEAGYVAQARGYHVMLQSLLAGESPSQEDSDAAYGRGTWPPLHPLVLAVAFLVFGPSLPVARGVSILVAAATTPLVWKVSTRLASRRAGWMTAAIHLVYPGFVGFAHLLWSENLFLFWLFLGLELGLRSRQSLSPGKESLFSGLAGLCFGLATLTRLSGAAMTVVFLAWLTRHSLRTRRFGPPLLAGALAVLVILPWQLEINRRESSRALLSAANGYNLLLGQIEVRDGETGPERKQRINRLIRAESERTGAGRDQAARRLALAEIRSDLPAFAQRCLARLPALFYGETHLVRHIYQLVYPPLPEWVALSLRFLLWLSYSLLLSLLVRGLWIRWPPPHHFKLLGGLAFAALLPALPTVASSRIGLPVVAVLLPFAGMALLRLVDDTSARRGFAVLLLGVLILQGIRHAHFERGSSWYSDLQLRLGLPIRAANETSDGLEEEPLRPPVGDAMLLRVPGASCSQVEIVAASPGLELTTGVGGAGLTRILWIPGQPQVFTLLVSSRSPEEVSTLRLDCRSQEELPGELFTLELAREAATWHAWRPVGSQGLEVYWWGSADARPIPTALLLP